MENPVLTYEQIMAMFAETDKQFKAYAAEADKRALEADKRALEANKQTQELKEQFKETDRLLKNLSKQVGKITDGIGLFAEHQVRPKILELFAQKGIHLKNSFARVKVEDDEGIICAEIDLLLVNTVYAVAVEIKNKIDFKDIDDQIDRIDKLQKMNHKLIEGTKIFGAVAGMIVEYEVEQYAHRKGLYLLKPNGEGVEISELPNFVPKIWDLTT
jgi:hypothetical protein